MDLPAIRSRLFVCFRSTFRPAVARIFFCHEFHMHTIPIFWLPPNSFPTVCPGFCLSPIPDFTAALLHFPVAPIFLIYCSRSSNIDFDLPFCPDSRFFGSFQLRFSFSHELPTSSISLLCEPYLFPVTVPVFTTFRLFGFLHFPNPESGSGVPISILSILSGCRPRNLIIRLGLSRTCYNRFRHFPRDMNFRLSLL